MDLFEVLQASNSFWQTGRVSEQLALPVKRDVFAKVVELFEYDRIIRLIGPRRTGKTVLMHQAIAHLLQKGVGPENIVFFSVDDPALIGVENVLEKTVDAYLDELNPKKPFIFIDEIQKAKNASLWLKSFFDKNQDAKVIVSGSSAAKMKREEKDSLLGRVFDLNILPLSFSEFARFSGEAPTEKLVKEYMLVGGYPEWFKVKNLELWQQFLVQDVLKKAVYDDLVTLYEIRVPQKLEQMLYFIAKQESQSSSINSLATALALDFETTANYLQYLKDAFLVYERRHYSFGGEKTVRKNFKYSINDCGLRNALTKTALLGKTETGLVAESACMQHLTTIAMQNNYSVYYWKNEHEIDFVVQTPNDLIPIEVKYQNNINSSDLRTIREFKQKHAGCKTAFLVTKNASREQDGITQIPLHEFLATKPLFE